MLMSLCPNFPYAVGKESACNARDPCSIPGLGRYAGEGIDYPLHYSWASLVAQLVKNPSAIQEWRRKWQPTPVFLLRESCGHRSLVGCCPWGRTESDRTGESQGKRSLVGCCPWGRTESDRTGESQGKRSLVGCCLWGRTELDTTEAT